LFPLALNIEHQPEYSRFLPLVKWLLAIPSLIVLYLLMIVGWFVILIAFFAVLITGRYPRALFDYVVGMYRWGYRAFAYVGLMTDRYPPFSLKDDPSHAVRFDVAYPEEGVDRWRPFVHWLLVIPYHLVASILGYLIFLMAFFAFFTILFTKKFPIGMFNLALNGMRWGARSNAYFLWLATRYPPFEWEPEQPAIGPAAPPA